MEPIIIDLKASKDALSFNPKENLIHKKEFDKAIELIKVQKPKECV